MTPQVLIVWCVACLLWSGTFLFIRVGVEHVPPLTFAWLRLLIALVVLSGVALARRAFSNLTRQQFVHVTAAGVLLLGVNYGLTYWGAQRLPSGLVAILQSATPVLALSIGWLAGVEGVTLRKSLAVFAGVAGIALTFSGQALLPGAGGLLGMAAVTGGSVAVATAYVWLKRRGGGLKPLTITTIQCFAGLMLLLPAGLAVEGNPLHHEWTPAAVGALMYLAIAASVVAFALNYWLLQHMDASAMLMMGVAEVPIAVILGRLVFNEQLPAGILAGGVCVLAGVILTLSPGGTRR